MPSGAASCETPETDAQTIGEEGHTGEKGEDRGQHKPQTPSEADERRFPEHPSEADIVCTIGTGRSARVEAAGRTAREDEIGSTKQQSAKGIARKQCRSSDIHLESSPPGLRSMSRADLCYSTSIEIATEKLRPAPPPLTRDRLSDDRVLA